MSSNKQAEIVQLIWEVLNSTDILCPDCGYSSIDDDQYTCTTCWCEGGNGRINTGNYIREYGKEIL